GLEEDRIGDANLADVVEDDAVLEGAQIWLAHPVGTGEAHRVDADTLGMRPGARVPRRDETAERDEGRALAAGERRQSRGHQVNLRAPPEVSRGGVGEGPGGRRPQDQIV